MERDFWISRWQEGRTGFHQDRITPLLEVHWNRVEAPDGAHVFVPLAGKSHDMQWLVSQGHPVLGAELSPMAIEQFFAEYAQGEPAVQHTAYGIEYSAANITMIEGDVFDLDAQRLADCDAVFDRAAIIALPTELRSRYAREVYAQLPTGCRGLMITLEYPQHEKNGPPFAVSETEIRDLFEPQWDVSVLERRDILAREPGFLAEGVTALSTVAYRLVKRS